MTLITTLPEVMENIRADYPELNEWDLAHQAAVLMVCAQYEMAGRRLPTPHQLMDEVPTLLAQYGFFPDTPSDPTPMTPSNDDLDAATRALIQTLLTIQYHQDLALVRDTPYRTRARRRHRQTALRNRYQGLGLHNTTIPVELQAW